MPLDVHDEMRDLSLAIMERVLFGRELDENGKQFRADVITAVEYVSPRVMSPVNPPDFLPPGRRYKAALERLERTVRREIEARGDGSGSEDLLGAIVAATDPETGDRMSSEQVRDEALTAVFGAYKGLPGGLTWIWYLLAQNPEVWDRVAHEVDATVGDRRPAAADVPRLSYLKAVIDEVLRLYPPLWIWSRPPVEEDEIGGYDIHKGMFVLCIPYVTHRHPDFWERPEEFDAERFAGNGESPKHPHAYFPFASGPRRCIGEAFSLLTIPLVVAAVTQRYRMRIEPDYEIKRALEFFLRPSNGLPVTLEPVA
jgi:cytochrome P450